jgi:hypothetical protein
MAVQCFTSFLLSLLGTGTVLFCDSHSYMRGVAAGAIDIKCDCFHKVVSDCSLCFVFILCECFSLILIHFYEKMNLVHFVQELLIYFVEIFIV